MSRNGPKGPSSPLRVRDLMRLGRRDWKRIMEATEVFAFNGDHRDREQVRPYLAAYAELREAGTHYNDDFRGKIPGVEDGNPLMVLPKGKRNRGYEAGNGRTVLVK